MSSHRITTVLIDLDGTLLPMDQNKFMASYLEAFAAKCKDLALPVDRALRALNIGFKAMVSNDGSMTNEQRFWKEFSRVMGTDLGNSRQRFVEFYRNEFTLLHHVASPNPAASELVNIVKGRGWRLILATTPVFPRPGTLERLRWAGLDSSSFDLITTYEDFSFAKPSIGYYNQILSMTGSAAQECLMIGNDVTEDMVAHQLGMDVFLVTDWLINGHARDISSFKRGSLQEACDYCRTLHPAEDPS